MVFQLPCQGCGLLTVKNHSPRHTKYHSGLKRSSQNNTILVLQVFVLNYIQWDMVCYMRTMRNSLEKPMMEFTDRCWSSLHYPVSSSWGLWEEVLSDLRIMCDSASSEPLAAANLDHTENCRTNHHVLPCLVLKGRESCPSSSNGSYWMLSMNQSVGFIVYLLVSFPPLSSFP